jgi:hypothetical protein
MLMFTAFLRCLQRLPCHLKQWMGEMDQPYVRQVTEKSVRRL